jgi:membrane associated rhomboid family serine protease
MNTRQFMRYVGYVAVILSIVANMFGLYEYYQQKKEAKATKQGLVKSDNSNDFQTYTIVISVGASVIVFAIIGLIFLRNDSK